MRQKAIIETESAEGLIDASLEHAADNHREKLDAFRKKPTHATLDELAQSLCTLKWKLSRALPCYGADYENGGRRFILLAEDTREAMHMLPERIKRMDGDRSAHGAITRFTREIITKVVEECGPDVLETSVRQIPTLRSLNQSI